MTTKAPTLCIICLHWLTFSLDFYFLQPHIQHHRMVNAATSASPPHLLMTYEGMNGNGMQQRGRCCHTCGLTTSCEHDKGFLSLASLTNSYWLLTGGLTTANLASCFIKCYQLSVLPSLAACLNSYFWAIICRFVVNIHYVKREREITVVGFSWADATSSEVSDICFSLSP